MSPSTEFEESFSTFSQLVSPMRNWELGLQLETLGRENKFELKTETVISAGSFSQIMQGTHNRAPVIVKLKRWQVDELLKRDVAFYQSALGVGEDVNLFVPAPYLPGKKSWWKFWTWFRRSQRVRSLEYTSKNHQFISNVLQTFLSELDFKEEAWNVKTMRKVYGRFRNDFQIINVAAVLPAKNPIALVMTIAPGKSLSHFFEQEFSSLSDEELESLRDKFWKLSTDIHQEAIYGSGYLHGDTNAGNIFYDPKLQQLTLIDFGRVGKMNQWQRMLETQLNLACATKKKSQVLRVLKRSTRSLKSRFSNWAAVEGLIDYVLNSPDCSKLKTEFFDRLENVGYEFGQDFDFFRRTT